MNKHVDPRTVPATTLAAEGMPRRKWTYDDVLKADEAGEFDPDDRFELIGGELVPMAAKGIRHEIVRDELNMYWGTRRPAHLKFSAETPLRLSKFDVPEPDFIIRPASLKLTETDGSTVLLAVEVAATSLPRDTGIKLRLYAEFGVREYWVIDAQTLVTTIYKQPSAAGYGSRVEIPPTQSLVPEAAPEMRVRLADLPID